MVNIIAEENFDTNKRLKTASDKELSTAADKIINIH